ncbi:hypothetical protein F5Y10DRAFT_287492 [Nemania abortiva]|nr:hypothetical protein F5Y10DRAFT_287492 [Nemania abortiva]
MPSITASSLRQITTCAICIAACSVVVYMLTADRQHDHEPKNPYYDWKQGWEPENEYRLRWLRTPRWIEADDDEGRKRTHGDWRQLCYTLPSPEALDFLLGCVQAAVEVKKSNPRYLKWFVLPDTFPLDPALVHEVTDSFPPLNQTSTIKDLIGTGDLRRERRILLMWLATNFGDQILTAQGDLHVPEVPSLAQFIQISSEPVHQDEFMAYLKTRGLEGGRAAFHGTPAINLLSILHCGLKAKGDGVYIASDPEISLQFIFYRGSYYNEKLLGKMKGWKNSAFKNVVVLFGVEVAQEQVDWNPFDRYYKGKCLTGEVSVRHMFLMPGDTLAFNTRRMVKANDGVSIYGGWPARATMEDVYRRIHAGDFNKMAS